MGSSPIGVSIHAAGNLLSDGTTTRSYDALSRLVAQAGTSYTYNGDGVLVNAGTTTYAQDLAAPLSQVLSDGTANYVYGHDRLRALSGPWYVGDVLGSVRQTLDDAGAVLGSVQYDPWGVPTAGTPQPFGFTGELHSAGQVYLRARWYAPGQGRFVSEDPFAGWSERPDSLHSYIYAGNNPVLYTDPRGETWYLSRAEADALGDDLRTAADEHANKGTRHWMTGLGALFLERYLSAKKFLPASDITMLPPLGLVFLGACIDHQQTSLGTMSEMIRDVNRDSPLGVALAYVPDYRPVQMREHMLEAGRLYALSRSTGKMKFKHIGAIEATKLQQTLNIGIVATNSRPVKGYSFAVDFTTLISPPPGLSDHFSPPDIPTILRPELTAYYEEGKALR